MRAQRKKAVQYNDSESDSEFLIPECETEAPVASGVSMIVEKVLGRKMMKNPDEVNQFDELFFIKWKKMSYLHASWERQEDIERVDPQAKMKIKRFMQAPQAKGILGMKASLESDEGLSEMGGKDVNGSAAEKGMEDDEEDEEEIEYFNPEVSEVYRIISCDTKTCSHSNALTPFDINPQWDQISPEELPWDPEDEVQYLVKWRGLSYSECTWERWADLKASALECFEFWQRQIPPSEPFVIPHPSIQEYQRMTVSPEFGVQVPFIDQVTGRSSASSDTFAPSSPSSSSSSSSSASSAGTGTAAANDSTDSKSNSSGKKDAVAEEPPAGLRLRDYQLEGVNWLSWNWWNKRSCILADEMGLGKTIQSTCFLQRLRTLKCTQVNGPFLLVAPLSLISQWQSEVAVWAPEINALVYHGSSEAKDIIQQYEFYYQEPYSSRAEVANLRKENITKFHLLLTTFETIIKDIKILSKIRWKVMIIDEAHRLKNPTSRLFEHLCDIPYQHCLLLTGTPLQNKTEELWALLHFADKVKFANQQEFLDQFRDLKDATQVAKLHTMLKPYLLRRVKEDVEKSLPPKEEIIIEVALTTIQKQFYRAVYERNTTFLFKGVRASNQPSLMNVMMELRKCCNHPYLLRGVEERIVSDLPIEDRESIPILQSKMIESSGKLSLLDKLLPRLFSQGHKVLIFSQMVRVLNIIEDFLRFKGYLYERLDGNTRASDRNDAVKRFGNPSCNRFVMLLSTKAGGLGLNLTAADTVIIFDSDWNPQNDLQAQARAHRIGQTKAVNVYRLITRKTYEMHMFHQASLKLGLDRAVLAHARNEQDEEAADRMDISGPSNKDKANMSAKEIDELLKRGAYDVFREDDTDQREFLEADIDLILERRAHKVDLTGGKGISASLGGFSKASFVSADQAEDVDINDPDFWRKAVGLSELPQGGDEETILFEEGGRKRRQIKVYGGEEFDDENFPENPHETKKERKDRLSKEKKEKDIADKKEKEREAKEKKEKEIIEKKEKVRLVKEKKEKEREEKLKIAQVLKEKKDASEAKAKSVDISLWGSHARDRVLRALGSYGFTRWERVRDDSGGELRTLKDIEKFSRAYVLRCGLIASENELAKSDTGFVRDTVLAARDMERMVRAGTIVFEFPPSLTDDKFITKLKGGNAKRVLHRLSMLGLLLEMMQKATQAAYTTRAKTLNTLNTQNAPNAQNVAKDFNTLNIRNAQNSSSVVKVETLAVMPATSMPPMLPMPPTSSFASSSSSPSLPPTFPSSPHLFPPTFSSSSLPPTFSSSSFSLPPTFSSSFSPSVPVSFSSSVSPAFSTSFSTPQVPSSSLPPTFTFPPTSSSFHSSAFSSSSFSPSPLPHPSSSSSSSATSITTSSSLPTHGTHTAHGQTDSKALLLHASESNENPSATLSPLQSTALTTLLGDNDKDREGPLSPPLTDVDRAMEELSVQELASHFPLGDSRPTWAQLQTWWDLECDIHFLIGVFKHGYGKYDSIRDDPALCFYKKIEAMRGATVVEDKEGGGVGGGVSGMGGVGESSGGRSASGGGSGGSGGGGGGGDSKDFGLAIEREASAEKKGGAKVGKLGWLKVKGEEEAGDVGGGGGGGSDDRMILCVKSGAVEKQSTIDTEAMEIDTDKKIDGEGKDEDQEEKDDDIDEEKEVKDDEEKDDDKEEDKEEDKDDEDEKEDEEEEEEEKLTLKLSFKKRPSSSPSVPSENKYTASTMPDPRTLNRLFAWLVTCPQAVRFKSDMVQSSPLLSTNRGPAIPDGVINKKRGLPLANFNKGQAITAAVEAKDIRILCEEEMMDRLQRGIYNDSEALAAVIKPSVQGLKRCVTLLSFPLPAPFCIPAPSSSSAVRSEGKEGNEGEKEKGEGKEEGKDGDTDGAMEIDGVLKEGEGEETVVDRLDVDRMDIPTSAFAAVSAVGDALTVRQAQGNEGMTVCEAVSDGVVVGEGVPYEGLTDHSTSRLCAAFILYGCPLQISPKTHGNEEDKDQDHRSPPSKSTQRPRGGPRSSPSSHIPGSDPSSDSHFTPDKGDKEDKDVGSDDKNENLSDKKDENNKDGGNDERDNGEKNAFKLSAIPLSRLNVLGMSTVHTDRTPHTNTHTDTRTMDTKTDTTTDKYTDNNTDNNTDTNTDTNTYINEKIGKMEKMEPSCIELFDIKQFTKVTGILINENELSDFYRSIWLPFCSNIFKKSTVLSHLYKKVIPSPMKKACDHHIASRGLCLIFLRRQQLLRAMHLILSDDTLFHNLLTLLMKPGGGSPFHDLSGLPVWWCPWIHDIALFIGCLKHGFLSLQSITQDPSLPFNPTALEAHVRKVFLYGCTDTLPAAFDELRDVESAETFVRLILHTFADPRDLEFRLTSILEEATGGLAEDHPCRIYNENEPRTDPVKEKKILENPVDKSNHNTSISATEETEINEIVNDENSTSTALNSNDQNGIGEKGEKGERTTDKIVEKIEEIDSKIEKIDPKTEKLVCILKRPPVSLTRFLRETEKRRRVILDEIIGSNN